MTTLIISEKPNASKRIAGALADDKPVKQTVGKVPYYEITRKGEKILVGCAVGHLFTLSEKEHHGWHYPVFDIGWAPSHSVSKSSHFSKEYLEVLVALAKKADKFVNGCDLDREGEVIFRNILRFVCKKDDARRMKFSTLTKEDLVNAYDNASPHLETGLAEAGETRHFLDYYWGISLSRALTLALKSVGGYKVLSTGRVQGPTLNILRSREIEIRKFKPVPFWQLELTFLAEGKENLAMHAEDKFWEKEKATSILSKCKGKPASVKSVTRREQKQSVPFPFDLTSMQREAHKLFGYSPKQTLDIAQSLYEAALISYPRTSSQKLPEKIGYKTIISNLFGQPNYSELCGRLLKGPRLKPNEGTKSDPAHPAIFPTGQKPKSLNQWQKKLYDLIVKRFLATFADPAVREHMKVVLDVEGEEFLVHGVRTLKANWIDFYQPYSKFKEQTLPQLKEGDVLDVKKLEMLSKETQPPNRLTQASILKEMEANELGTKATRAHIIHTLYDRGYIKEDSVVVTKLGDVVISALDKYCPEIISVDFTKDMEKDMELIEEGKKGKEEVLESAKKELKTHLDKFKKHEKDIGQELFGGMMEVIKEETTIGTCLKCGKDLVIRHSRAGKRFVGCMGYPKCTETFSLPHFGKLTILSENCKKCGLHIVLVRAPRKRPWKLCVHCGFVNKIPKKGAKGKKAPAKKPAAKAAKPAKKKAAPKKTAKKAAKK